MIDQKWSFFIYSNEMLLLKVEYVSMLIGLFIMLSFITFLLFFNDLLRVKIILSQILTTKIFILKICTDFRLRNFLILNV